MIIRRYTLFPLSTHRRDVITNRRYIIQKPSGYEKKKQKKYRLIKSFLYRPSRQCTQVTRGQSFHFRHDTRLLTVFPYESRGAVRSPIVSLRMNNGSSTSSVVAVDVFVWEYAAIGVRCCNTRVFPLKLKSRPPRNDVRFENDRFPHVPCVNKCSRSAIDRDFFVTTTDVSAVIKKKTFSNSKNTTRTSDTVPRART